MAIEPIPGLRIITGLLLITGLCLIRKVQIGREAVLSGAPASTGVQIEAQVASHVPAVQDRAEVVLLQVSLEEAGLPAQVYLEAGAVQDDRPHHPEVRLEEENHLVHQVAAATKTQKFNKILKL